MLNGYIISYLPMVIKQLLSANPGKSTSGLGMRLDKEVCTYFQHHFTALYSIKWPQLPLIQIEMYVHV